MSTIPEVDLKIPQSVANRLVALEAKLSKKKRKKSKRYRRELD